MSLAATPVRKLTQKEIQDFENDGVIMVKRLVEKNWLNMIEQGVEEATVNASVMGKFMSRKTEGYQMDAWLWKRIDVLRDLIYYSPFAHWAQQLMSSEEVRFFYDQMFVKEPGTDAPTPWHQDLTFWPIRGNQICSFWIPLDSVTRESSGLQYVRGSHKWPNRFRAVSPDYVASMLDSELELVPDINADPQKYDVVDWDMEPGDALIFHPLTLHGSSGNKTRTQRRRALALRWVGEDVVYAPGKATMPVPYKHDSEPGRLLQGYAFPRILPTHIPAERVIRSKGVESVVASTIAKSVSNNALSAAKLLFSGFKADSVKQTW